MRDKLICICGNPLTLEEDIVLLKRGGEVVGAAHVDCADYFGGLTEASHYDVEYSMPFDAREEE